MERVLVTVLRQMFSVLSPQIRNAVAQLLRQLKANAEATPNPWDDLFVDFLIRLLDVELPSE